MICPCKSCTDRHPACHDTCGKYAAWRKDFAAKKDSARPNEADIFRIHMGRAAGRIKKGGFDT